MATDRFCPAEDKLRVREFWKNSYGLKWLQGALKNCFVENFCRMGNRRYKRKCKGIKDVEHLPNAHYKEGYPPSPIPCNVPEKRVGNIKILAPKIEVGRVFSIEKSAHNYWPRFLSKSKLTCILNKTWEIDPCRPKWSSGSILINLITSNANRLSILITVIRKRIFFILSTNNRVDWNYWFGFDLGKINLNRVNRVLVERWFLQTRSRFDFEQLF